MIRKFIFEVLGIYSFIFDRKTAKRLF